MVARMCGGRWAGSNASGRASRRRRVPASGLDKAADEEIERVTQTRSGLTPRFSRDALAPLIFRTMTRAPPAASAG